MFYRYIHGTHSTNPHVSKKIPVLGNPHQTTKSPFFCLLTACIAASLVLSGCSSSSTTSKTPADSTQENGSSSTSDSQQETDETTENSTASDSSLPQETLAGKLIDGAGTDTWILESDDTLYSMKAQNLQIENGMYLTITYNGEFIETAFPILENVSSVEIDEQERDNRYAIGWTILESIWEEDATIQNNIDILCIDLSEAAFLSKGEKEYLTHTFMTTYGTGKTLIEDTFEQLQADGYLTEDGRIFENGVYLRLSSTQDTATLTLEAEKWHSLLGAVYMDFTAEKAAEQWTLTLDETAVA